MTSEFVDYVKELFSEFGEVKFRKMFGGYGVFHQGLMIGLIADDSLYLKGDHDTEPQFLDHGLSKFRYRKKDKWVDMSYWTAPVEALDDPGEMARWADLAYGAALRSKS